MDALDPLNTVRPARSRRRKWRVRLTLLVISRVLEGIAIWRATRRLEAVDDALLKDIGISRGDIAWIVRHGRWPSRRRSRE